MLRDFSDHRAARGVDELLQFLEVLAHLMLRVRPFARRPDENRSLDRGL
jgi:hypothetical protein